MTIDIADSTDGSVRIARLRAIPLAFPLTATYHWQAGADRVASTVLYEVTTTDGLKGYGEAVSDHPRVLEELSKSVAEFFVGQPPGCVERALNALWSRGRWRVTGRLTSQLVNGIEAACWDVLGKQLGVPAATFFGGPVRDEVDVFGFIQGDTDRELAQHAAELAGEGYQTLYMKIGRSVGSEDVKCVAAVRDVIGREPTLRVDANEAWDVPTAIDQIRRLEEYDIDWVEQPVAGDNIGGLAQVRRAVGPKIAADNAVYSSRELLRVLEAEAADVVVLSAHELGGLWRMRQAGHLAECFGIPVNRKGHLETTISGYAALQAMGTIPALTSGNQMTHHLLADQVTLDFPAVHRGKMRIPAGPGLGFRVDEEGIERAHYRFKELAETSR